MFGRKGKKEAKDTQKKIEKLNKPLGDSQLDSSLEKNIQTMDELFRDVDTMLSRRFQNNGDKALDFCIYYSDGVVDSLMINEHIIKPLLLAEELEPGVGLFDAVRFRYLMMNDVKVTTDLTEIVQAVTYGDTLLLMEGSNQGLILSSKNFTLRAVAEPEEKVLNGPREGFTEGLMVNLSLLRRRLRTNQLKLKFRTMGRQTATTICVCYLENIVNRKLLRELYRRLDTIDIDGILDSNYISEHIAERSALGFMTCGYTERPDIVVAKLLEGRIAVVVDGTPQVLTLPYLFIENFQSNEDYYLDYIYASFSRMLRIISFFLTVTVPAIYVAIESFHHEILPTALMIGITNERQSVPLPAAMEAIVMLLVFDFLREAGIRMPSNVGQALSIVGALVIGQAAVEAKLVASPMIIVVAFTGITCLLIPKMTVSTLFGRYGCLLLAAGFGIVGVAVGLSILCIHILNLQSFGVPSLLPVDRLQYQDVKDLFTRAPWPKMLTRIAPLSDNRIRSRPKPVDQEGGELR